MSKILMLPDFPRSRRELSERLRLALRLLVQKKSPLVSLAQSFTQHEGKLHSYAQQAKTGATEITEGFKEVSVQMQVRFEEVPDLVGDNLASRINHLAEEIAARTDRLGFAKLREVTEAAGTGVDAKGSGLTKELFLSVLEKMEMTFNPETGEPEVVLFVHPDMAPTLKKLDQEWQQDLNFQRKHANLIAQKREAWRDRESRRKLVD